jgi:hypothetical protein
MTRNVCVMQRRPGCTLPEDKAAHRCVLAPEGVTANERESCKSLFSIALDLPLHRAGGDVVGTSHLSQDPIGVRNLPNQAADQKAEWKRDEHRDVPFEQRIQCHHVEGIGKTDQHRGMDQVHGVDISG